MRKINARMVVWTVVAVIVVVGIVWYAVSVRGPGGQNNGQHPQAAAPVYAPQGQIVTGFPRELILDSIAGVNNSYSVNYSAGVNQYTAQWNSSNSMAALYDAYEQYLPANGWTITNDVKTQSWFRGLYATNASAEVSIAISTQGKGSQAVVTYLAK